MPGRNYLKINENSTPVDSNVRPEEEGIKTRVCTDCRDHFNSNVRPEEEGIKTSLSGGNASKEDSNVRPEEEGIKTPVPGGSHPGWRIQTSALKKKGLRLDAETGVVVRQTFKRPP